MFVIVEFCLNFLGIDQVLFWVKLTPLLLNGEHLYNNSYLRYFPQMACFDSSKESLEDSFDGAAGGKLSGCALAMSEKERESLLNPSESPSTYMSGASSSFQDATHQQGYDVEFDPPLESKYECPICLMALRNAIQTPCGHRFCKICIEKSIR